MKKVIYITVKKVPYRTAFFNKLSEYCDLTVLYEKDVYGARNKTWCESEKIQHRAEYLKTENGSVWSLLKIVKYIHGDFDVIILGCYNSPIQMFANLWMKVFRIPFILNVDGEIFIKEHNLKNLIKKFFLRGAESYLSAGEKAVESLRKVVGQKPITAYHFSSLTQDEVTENAQNTNACHEDAPILVVGQYFDYKGMDIALEVAKKNKSIKYKFVGMGSRSEAFAEKYNTKEVENVEIIPFLQKTDLENEYRNCRAFLLPTRQECWGLVINEAASFGTPIVSTWGSGAAVEFLADAFPMYLAKPDDPDDLYEKVELLLKSDVAEYQRYLIEKSQEYSIEAEVQAHLAACGIESCFKEYQL